MMVAMLGHHPSRVTIIHLSSGSTKPVVHTIRTRLGAFPRSLPCLSLGQVRSAPRPKPKGPRCRNLLGLGARQHNKISNLIRSLLRKIPKPLFKTMRTNIKYRARAHMPKLNKRQNINHFLFPHEIRDLITSRLAQQFPLPATTYISEVYTALKSFEMSGLDH